MAKKNSVFVRYKWLIAAGSGGGALIFIGLLFFLAPDCQQSSGFITLTDAQTYASQVPELPTMDNTNMVRPDYTTFHRSQIKNCFQRKLTGILSLVGLARLPVWTPRYFGELLERSVTYFTAKKLRKNIVYKVTPTPGTQFVVWGDVLGAYHSLVRDLSHLQEMGVVDDSLRIVTDNTFFVFMGDVISRSPFGMETLSLVLRLIEVNPKKVVYLRGNHEDNKYWHAFGLKEQLEARASDLHNDAYVSMVDDLFTQLPLGLYLPIPGSVGHYARLSHLGRDKSTKLKEERFAHFLAAAQVEPIDGHQFDKSVMHNGKVFIDGIIRSEKKRHSFQTMDGLRLLEPDQGSTAWTILSSPTRVQQEGLKFFHDAFAIVTVGDHSGQWSITLHAQDAREKKGFYQRSYQFFTGQQMTLEEIALVPDEPATTSEEPPEQPKETASLSVPTAPTPVSEMPHTGPQYRKVLRRVVQQPVSFAPVQSSLPASAVANSSVQPSQPLTIQPQENQAVSVTVTPPLAGANDQSTVVSVSVKIPPRTDTPSAKNNEVFSGSVPTVIPVMRGDTSEGSQSSKAIAVGNTAARVGVLDQVEGS